MTSRDHYEVLQVTSEAEQEVVEAAYKRLAFKFHPDRNPDPTAETRIREINAAYEVLRDPQKRMQYDGQRNAENWLQQLSQRANTLLDQGIASEEVIKELIKMGGVDLENAARIVGFIAESRRNANSILTKPEERESLLLKIESWLGNIWLWTGIGAVFILFTMFTERKNNAANATKHRFAFKQSEIFYSDRLSTEIVKKIADILAREGYITDRKASVNIEYTKNGRYEVQFVVSDEALISPQVDIWQELGNIISRECVDGSPVDIHLCDRNFELKSPIMYKYLPPLLNELNAGWNTGVLTHDFQIVNKSAKLLTEVQLTFRFYREDGHVESLNKYWSTWKSGESKDVNVPSQSYQKTEVKGVAMVGATKVRIDSYWTHTWK